MKITKQSGSLATVLYLKTLLLIAFLSVTANTMSQQLIIREKVKFLALGDSYTIGESVPQNARWPVQLVDSLRKRGLESFDAKIIATTGWRTDQLKDAISAANLKNDYNLVALLIGVNNQYQGKSSESYAPEFEDLLKKAVTLAGNVKSNVFVVSIPDYGYTPFGSNNQPAISKAIDAYNEVNKSIAAEMGIQYFDITPISRQGLSFPDLVAGDGLHPSGKMYTAWVELILKGAELVTNGDQGDGSNEPGEITGIRDERYGLNLYPNPFQQKIFVSNLLFLEQPVSVILLDNNGGIAFQKDYMQQDHIEIDTTQLAPGPYHYQVVQSNGESITGKLIKQ